MTREGPMDGDPERRIEALEKSQRETVAALGRLLEISSETNAKLAVMDAKLDGKATAADVAAISAKLDAKASIADVAAVSAKLDAKANIADVAKYEPLVKAVADVVIDIRTIRDNARTDYRALFGAIITVALGLAALIAKSFHWV